MQNRKKRSDVDSLAFSCVDTSLGLMLIAATSKGVCVLRFGDVGTEDELENGLQDEFPNASLSQDPRVVDPYIKSALEYLARRSVSLDWALDVSGTGFQQEVWSALRSIPRGQLRSYRQVAEAIGRPKAVRAVGSACGANPTALAIPCHRVVKTGGEIGGYRWGVERKKHLLRLEGSLD